MPALEHILTDKQINPTAMRMLVLEYLLQQNTAVSLADVEKNLHHSDRVTLYRTLKTFEEKCLIHKIEDGSGATKYALCKEDCSADENHHDLHVHFYCNDCKETFCLPKTQIPDVQIPAQFRMQEISLIVKGICGNCSAKMQ